jgi:hypothetical protein
VIQIAARQDPGQLFANQGIMIRNVSGSLH